MIDDRENNYNLTTSKIKKICSRNFYVDPRIYCFKSSSIADIKMLYYNSNGLQVLCVAMELDVFSFSLSLGIIEKTLKLKHLKEFLMYQFQNNLVLKNKNIDDITLLDNKAYLNSVLSSR